MDYPYTSHINSISFLKDLQFLMAGIGFVFTYEIGRRKKIKKNGLDKHYFVTASKVAG